MKDTFLWVAERPLWNTCWNIFRAIFNLWSAKKLLVQFLFTRSTNLCASLLLELATYCILRPADRCSFRQSYYHWNQSILASITLSIQHIYIYQNGCNRSRKGILGGDETSWFEFVTWNAQQMWVTGCNKKRWVPFIQTFVLLIQYHR